MHVLEAPAARRWLLMHVLKAGPHTIDLATPCVMGVVNITADSFFDGGRLDTDAAIDHARRMLDAGARIVDVGGESTRPGAAPVDAEEELRRVVPVVATTVPISPVASAARSASRSIRPRSSDAIDTSRAPMISQARACV